MFGRAGARSGQFLLILAAVTVTVYGLLQIRLVVVAALVALILAAAVGPVVRFLRGHGWPGSLATITTFLAILIVLSGVTTGIVFAIRSEWDELVSSARAGWEQLQEFIQSGPIPIEQGQIDAALQAVIGFVTSEAMGRSALSGLSIAAEFLTGFLLMAVILFFFLKDGDRIWWFLLRWFPRRTRNRLELSGNRAMAVLGGYVRGTATVAAADSIVIGIALLVLQVPLALPLALIVFIGAFIPLIGATIAGILAALVALVANGPINALIVVGVVVLVQELEGDFLQPVVMGQALKLHALVVLIALTAGTILGGIIGAVLGVPLTAVAWATIKVWTRYDSGEAETSSRSRPRAGIRTRTGTRGRTVQRAGSPVTG
jgi:putative heme transporter